MNLASIIVLLVLFGLFVLAYRTWSKGSKCSCGGSCSTCGKGCSCGKDRK